MLPPLAPRRFGNPSTFAIDFEPSPDPEVCGLTHYGLAWYWLGGRRFLGDWNDPVCMANSEMKSILEMSVDGRLDAHPEFFDAPAHAFVRRIQQAKYRYRADWSSEEQDLWCAIGYCHHVAILQDHGTWNLCGVLSGSTLRLVCGKFSEPGRPKSGSQLIGPVMDLRLPFDEVAAVATEYCKFFQSTPCIEEEFTFAAREYVPPTGQPREVPPLPKGWDVRRV